MSSKLYDGDNLQVLREHVGNDHGTNTRLQHATIPDLLIGQLPRNAFGYSESNKRAAREEEKQGLLI